MGLRVLCLNIPGGTATPHVLEDFCQAFWNCRHEVRRVDIGDLIRAAQQRSLPQYCKWLVNDFRPDFILSYDYWTLYPCVSSHRTSLSPFEPILGEPVESVWHLLGVKTVSFFGDDPLAAFGALEHPATHFEQPLRSGMHASFVWSPQAQERFAARGYCHSSVLPLAVNPKRLPHGKIQGRVPRIAFVGTYTERRERYLAGLKDLGLEVYGNAAWKRCSLADCYSGAVSYGEDAFSLYRLAAMTVDVLARDGYWLSQRAFDIWGSGGFLLSERVPRMDVVFGTDDILVTYGTPEELEAAATYYAENPVERSARTTAARNVILKKHTYERRVRSMVDRLQELAFV